MVDVLHTLDQGLSIHCIANVYWVFAVLRICFGGATYADRIKCLAADLKTWYQRTGERTRLQGALTLERVRTNGGWPKLKAKAAATRHLIAYALFIVTRFGDPADPTWGNHDVLAQGLLQCIQEFYLLIDAESQFLSPGARTRLPELGMMIGSLYTQLANIGFGMEAKIWKMMPKIHLVDHLCYDQAPVFGNPRYFWTYGDEDLIGQLIDMSDQLHPASLAASMLTKWVLCVFDKLILGDTEE